MKTKILLAVLMFVSLSCFGKKEYTISKSDFISQFTNPYGLRIYCFNETGARVWLHCNKNTQLILKLKSNEEKVLMLETVKYVNETIEAIEYNVWMPGNKVSIFAMDDVQSLIIKRKYQEYESPYFNLDSSRNIAKLKNDSLKKEYSAKKELTIVLPAKSNKDTLLISPDACYHINFKDNNQVKFGVVQQITKDSIYISSSFNAEMAAKDKKDYTVYQYPISDISGLSLLKSGGYSYRTINIGDYDVLVKKADKSSSFMPYWYAVNPGNGAIKFYRTWLTDSGFLGITETNGRAIWYEGE